MKLNKTNCNLNTCIKRRKIYFKNRHFHKKSRLLSFLLLLKSSFFLLFNNANYKNISSFFELRFYKKFFRTRWGKGQLPDLRNVNFKRGSRRRSPKVTLSTQNQHLPDYRFVNCKRGARRYSSKLTIKLSIDRLILQTFIVNVVRITERIEVHSHLNLKT